MRGAMRCAAGGAGPASPRAAAGQARSAWGRSGEPSRRTGGIRPPLLRPGGNRQGTVQGFLRRGKAQRCPVPPVPAATGTGGPAGRSPGPPALRQPGGRGLPHPSGGWRPDPRRTWRRGLTVLCPPGRRPAAGRIRAGRARAHRLRQGRRPGGRMAGAKRQARPAAVRRCACRGPAWRPSLSPGPDPGAHRPLPHRTDRPIPHGTGQRPAAEPPPPRQARR